MNIAIVGSTPVQPPVHPAVPPVTPAAATAATTSQGDAGTGTGSAPGQGRGGAHGGAAGATLTLAERAERATAEAARAQEQLKLQVPEVKHISTTEMQVIWGALPAEVLYRGGKGFDTYA